MLEYREISVVYQKKTVVDHFSMKFAPKKITTLVGPNGSGKTTLFQTLNQMTTPDQGQILLDGQEIGRLAPRERAKKVAYLPQIRETIPSLTVKTLVEHGRFPYMGFTRSAGAADREKIKEAMEMTQVLEYQDCKVDTLSGGIRQRVYLAMVLAQDSELIVLDEPTTYLDLKSQADFLKIVSSLREKGKTILLVLHDLHQALSISDELIVMDKGIQVFQGSPKSCVESGILESVFQVKTYEVQVGTETKYFFE